MKSSVFLVLAQLFLITTPIECKGSHGHSGHSHSHGGHGHASHTGHRSSSHSGSSQHTYPSSSGYSGSSSSHGESGHGSSSHSYPSSSGYSGSSISHSDSSNSGSLSHSYPYSSGLSGSGSSPSGFSYDGLSNSYRHSSILNDLVLGHSGSLSHSYPYSSDLSGSESSLSNTSYGGLRDDNRQQSPSTLPGDVGSEFKVPSIPPLNTPQTDNYDYLPSHISDTFRQFEKSFSFQTGNDKVVYNILFGNKSYQNNKKSETYSAPTEVPLINSISSPTSANTREEYLSTTSEAMISNQEQNKTFASDNSTLPELKVPSLPPLNTPKTDKYDNLPYHTRISDMLREFSKEVDNIRFGKKSYQNSKEESTSPTSEAVMNQEQNKTLVPGNSEHTTKYSNSYFENTTNMPNEVTKGFNIPWQSPAPQTPSTGIQYDETTTYNPGLPPKQILKRWLQHPPWWASLLIAV